LNTVTKKESESAILQAASILRGGGLVAFPTETVYGLGGNALDPDAAKKIYAAKGRPSNNPLIVHIAYPEDAEKYAHTCELYYKIADAFMPGPITVILPKREVVPSEVTGGLDSVALRCPEHQVAHELIMAAGVPIAAPSANISGSPSPTSAEHVIHDLDGKIDMILDGGECRVGLESTIVKVEGDHLIMLRPGGVTYSDLISVCERVEIANAVVEAPSPDETPLSPGMLYRHYAPKASLALLDGDFSKRLEFMREKSRDPQVALICSEEIADAIGKCEAEIFTNGKEEDYVSQAHGLFSALRRADESRAERIYAAMPLKSGMGLALYNRLIRAASYNIIKL
jgi:L-threonylcarbamoyladenylate synthase